MGCVRGSQEQDGRCLLFGRGFTFQHLSLIHILPKKLGVEATSKNLNDLKLKKANDAKLAAEILAAAKELAAKLDESKVTLSIKAGEGGRAFGSVSNKEISKAITDQLGLEIDKKKIVLNDPIKSIGSFEVPIKLHKDVTARLAVKVVEA